MDSKFKFKKIQRGFSLAVSLGVIGLLRLIRIYMLDSLLDSFCSFLAKTWRWALLRRKGVLLKIEFKTWMKKKDDIIANGWKSEWTGIDILGLEPVEISNILKGLNTQKEIVIASIDQDGYLMSFRGAMSKIQQIPPSEFVKRKRFELSMVSLKGGRLGIKKNYSGDKRSFLNELKALHLLSNRNLNVPGVLDVDSKSPSLVISYVPGEVVRESLVKAGAMIRDRDVECENSLKIMAPVNRMNLLIERAKNKLNTTITPTYMLQLSELIRKIHACGIVINDIKYGNLIIHNLTGAPWLIDFDSSILSLKRGYFRELRDHDMSLFNLQFGKEELTRLVVKRKIDEIAQGGLDIYAPFYIGGGIKIGNIYSIDSGFGKWHHMLKKSLPSFIGKKVLDLGANNASNSLAMLRDGAMSAVAVEYDEKAIKQGEFIKNAIEWYDNRHYDLKYIHANMANVVTMDLGKFDIAMALCSIYYLDDEDINKLIAHVAKISDIFILQCNLCRDMGRANAYTYEKASIEYAIKALRDNGFPNTTTVTPLRYQRPIVIGKKSEK